MVAGSKDSSTQRSDLLGLSRSYLTFVLFLHFGVNRAERKGTGRGRTGQEEQGEGRGIAGKDRENQQDDLRFACLLFQYPL